MHFSDAVVDSCSRIGASSSLPDQVGSPPFPEMLALLEEQDADFFLVPLDFFGFGV